MKRFIALTLILLTLATTLIVSVPVAFADSDWRGVYLTYLQQCYKTFKSTKVKIPVEFLSFTDLDRDAKPEMIAVINRDAEGTMLARLLVFTIDGAGNVVQTGKYLDMGKRALSLKMQYCEHAGEKAWLILSAYRNTDGSRVDTVRKLTKSESVALFLRRTKAGKTEYAMTKSGATQTVGKSAYTAAYKKFFAEVKKIGGTNPITKVTGKNASALKSAAKSANTKYAKYAKVKAIKVSILGKVAKRYTFSLGKQYDVRCAVTPASAIGRLTIASSNESVLTVNNDTMQIRTIAAGTAVLRVKDAAGATTLVRVRVVNE